MKTYSFEQIAKKNKRQTLILITGVSVLMTLVLLFLAHRLLTRKTEQSLEETRAYYDRMHKIAYPNIGYKYGVFEKTSEFSGYYHMDRVKTIAGLQVAYEDIDAPYGVLKRRSYLNSRGNIDMTPGQTAAYTLGSGHKSPMFYNPAYDYGQESGFNKIKTQDIALLPQMKGYAVEMAVTFDKPYNLTEIEEKIPDNLQVAWYWIGARTDQYDTAMLSPDEQLGFALDPYLVRDGKKVADKDMQEVWQMSYQAFTEHLTYAIEEDWLQLTYSSSKGEIYNLEKDAKAYLKANPTVETAKFSGVILTGRAEDFSGLEGQDWIFASNIGEDILIKPYHQLK